jgi:hypothetical protein
MQAAVGIWNAYFISARRWGVGGHDPLDTLIKRLRSFWTTIATGSYVWHYAAEQTLLTLCFVGFGLPRHAHRRGPRPACVEVPHRGGPRRCNAASRPST